MSHPVPAHDYDEQTLEDDPVIPFSQCVDEWLNDPYRENVVLPELDILEQSRRDDAERYGN